MRSAVLLGLSVGAAEALAGCTSPGPAAPVTTASPTPTGIAHDGLQPYEWKIGADRIIHVQEPNVKAVPTIAPPPAVMPPTATPAPLMWQGTAWSCPACLQRFCETCLSCAYACPAQAIPRGERSLELTSISNRPGIKRWHVNVGQCFLFWISNQGVDCSNCIAACPWSLQSRPWL
jgi:ferredoxin